MDSAQLLRDGLTQLKSGYDDFFGIFGGAADYFNHGADALRAYLCLLKTKY